MRAFLRSSILTASSFAVLVLSGCANNFDPSQGEKLESSTVTMQGEVFGGFFPVAGSKVFLFQVGTGGVGGASISEISASTTGSAIDTTPGSITNGARYVLTDTKGGFNFTSTCTANQYVYLYAAGGVATTGGSNNPQLGLMSVVGMCPASGTVDAVPFVRITENTTVAAAYALAGFATDPGHISYTGTALGLVGLGNAFGTATNLFNQLVPVNSTASVNGFTAVTTTAGSTGTIPQTLLNTLSNILVACVNSGNSASATTSGCNILRENATTSGTATTGPTAPATGSFGTGAPSDTATAMINIAHHPFANIGSIYGLQGTGANNLYKPSLSAAPTSFMVEVQYSGGGQGGNSLLVPKQLAIDGQGNVWGVNPAFSDVLKFSALGVPLGPFKSSTCSLTGNPSTKLVDAIALDVSGNAWVGTAQAQNSVCELTSTGGTVFFLPTSTPGDVTLNAGVYDMAFDASGNIWVVDNNVNNEAGALYEISPSHSIVTSVVGNSLSFPYALAIDAPGSFGSGHTGDIWVANCDCAANGVTGTTDYDSVFLPSGAKSTSNPSSPAFASSINQPTGVAIDNGGNVWSLSFPGASKSTASGAAAGYFNYASNNNEIAISIDGGGNVWIVNHDDGGATYYDITELNNAGTELTPASGFVSPNSSGGNYPYSIAVDGSGNVWFQMNNDANARYLHQLVGAAVPVATPLAYGTANNKLGARP